MDILQAIVLGVVEGVTEFLPISSTFHLIFVSKLLGVQQDEFAKLFAVFIQSGAILSVIFLYYKELIKDHELLKKTLIAFIPTALVGLLLYSVIKGVFFESDILMVISFILVGVIFILFEKYLEVKKVHLKKNISSLTYQDAVVIGLIQSLAVMPGVSRAGAVLLGMMLMKFKRDEAAKFSFILAVPTILAASVFDLYKGKDYLLSHGASTMILLTGFLTALFSSYFVITWLIDYLKKHSLTVFGIYRIVVGLILLFMLFR